jgi:hypothetical protein
VQRRLVGRACVVRTWVRLVTARAVTRRLEMNQQWHGPVPVRSLSVQCPSPHCLAIGSSWLLASLIVLCSDCTALGPMSVSGRVVECVGAVRIGANRPSAIRVRVRAASVGPTRSPVAECASVIRSSVCWWHLRCTSESTDRQLRCSAIHASRLDSAVCLRRATLAAPPDSTRSDRKRTHKLAQRATNSAHTGEVERTDKQRRLVRMRTRRRTSRGEVSRLAHPASA